MNRIPSLDGLRGIAILIVLLSHFNHLFKIQLIDDLFGAGIVGVYIFFVLSGFLITTLLKNERKRTQAIKLSDFYKRRILRIVPLSWLYIIVIVILNKFLKGSFANNYFIPTLYLTNISALGSTSYLFLHYWSLAAEEQYYFLVPPFLKYLGNYFSLILIIFLLLTFITRYLHTAYPQLFALRLLFDIFRNLDGLLIGSIFALIYQHKYFPLKFLLRFRLLLNIILFPLLLLLNHETSNVWLKVFANHSFYSILIGVIIIINIYPSKDVFFKVLNSIMLVRIGIISYSLYIWQQLFSSGIIPLPPFICFLLTFIIAFLSYKYFETPFLKMKKKYTVV
jgi:peptidoglycan/LPS O-acetylase OafA/YrhL